jgi:hypothetical protein
MTIGFLFGLRIICKFGQTVLWTPLNIRIILVASLCVEIDLQFELDWPLQTWNHSYITSHEFAKTSLNCLKYKVVMQNSVFVPCWSSLIDSNKSFTIMDARKVLWGSDDASETRLTAILCFVHLQRLWIPTFYRICNGPCWRVCGLIKRYLGINRIQ